MKTVDETLFSAKETLETEASAVQGLIPFLDEQFSSAVRTILEAEGRVLVTGIGKSAIIGQKIVATFNSTGTPAVFMHAADAVHGDLGNVQRGDVVICISNSGDTPEIKLLVPLIRNLGGSLIAMVGKKDSHLAQRSDLVLMTRVEKEACPIDLAPTSSTMAQLAMGDALAICLMEERGFGREDFARYHPGGSLGKKLYLRMGDLLDPDNKPFVAPDAPLQELIYEISSKRLGVTAVLDPEKGELIGVITDGDLRRMLENSKDFSELTAGEIMTKDPKTLDRDELAVEGFQMMEEHQITQVLITHEDAYLGAVHLHDILKEGIY
ncbi:MAG: SIS domain-containing protein [Flavobacteriales bacterium]